MWLTGGKARAYGRTNRGEPSWGEGSAAWSQSLCQEVRRKMQMLKVSGCGGRRGLKVRLRRQVGVSSLGGEVIGHAPKSDYLKSSRGASVWFN